MVYGNIKKIANQLKKCSFYDNFDKIWILIDDLIKNLKTNKI
jgi:hypothetical protein